MPKKPIARTEGRRSPVVLPAYIVADVFVWPLPSVAIAVAAVTDDLCTGLDRFLATTRERLRFDRFGYRERAHKIAECVDDELKLVTMNPTHRRVVPQA